MGQCARFSLANAIMGNCTVMKCHMVTGSCSAARKYSDSEFIVFNQQKPQQLLLQHIYCEVLFIGMQLPLMPALVSLEHTDSYSRCNQIHPFTAACQHACCRPVNVHTHCV